MGTDQKIDAAKENSEQNQQFKRMLADKFVCQTVGIKLLEVSPGKSKAQIEIGPSHLNGVGICQGGVLFTLADYVLAAASNYNEEAVVSLDVSISFCKAAKIGDLLMAEGIEVSRSRSTVVGDATIRNKQGQTIALARGRGFILQK